MSNEQYDMPNETTPTEDSSTEKNVKEDEDRTVNIQVKEDDQEDNEEKDEDQKETKKPLIDDNEEKKEVAITVHEDEENDTPTLPMKKKRTSDVTDETGSPSEKRPSMFISPFKRMKYEWEHSSSVAEFIGKVICIVFASVGWIVLVGGIPFLSIIELIIGSVYLYDCPAESRIPEYLIVAGVFGTVLHGVSVFTKYAPKSAQNVVNPHKARCRCIEVILQIFLFIWFIAGCVWVYSIYEPEYVYTDHDEYCHKGLYLFTFWMFNLTFIIFCIIVCLALCGIAAIAFSS